MSEVVTRPKALGILKLHIIRIESVGQHNVPMASDVIGIKDLTRRSSYLC